MTTNKLYTLFGATLLGGVLGFTPNLSDLSQKERELYTLSSPEGKLQRETPFGLRLQASFEDYPLTPQKPDRLTLTLEQRTGPNVISLKQFVDNGLDGLNGSQGDSYLEGGNSLALLSEKNRRQANLHLQRALEQLLAYAHNPSGNFPALSKLDKGVIYPDEVPTPGMFSWRKLKPGLEIASLDVLFRGQISDRIKLARIDPKRYQFQIHNDPSLRTIEQWQEDLGSLVVVNGSFYTQEPYGYPDIPMILNGVPKGPIRYTSSHGAFLAEPAQSGKPYVKMLDFKGKKKVELEKEGYKTATASYPTLIDFEGRVRAARNPRWRANRTFVALDRENKVLLGNTQGGFFSLNRLGHFLKATPELRLTYALNLDGGPPSCMVINAGDFRYVHYGVWETNDSTGQEELYWNENNSSKWEIPIVISVTERQKGKK